MNKIKFTDIESELAKVLLEQMRENDHHPMTKLCDVLADELEECKISGFKKLLVLRILFASCIAENIQASSLDDFLTDSDKAIREIVANYDFSWGRGS